MTDLEKVKMMKDMNWKPAAQYWKEQYEKAKAASGPIKDELELQYDSDGIWLVNVGFRPSLPHRGHIPWQTIAVYLKEYLKE